VNTQCSLQQLIRGVHGPKFYVPAQPGPLNIWLGPFVICIARPCLAKPVDIWTWPVYFQQVDLQFYFKD